MTAFEKVQSLYRQLEAGGKVGSRVFESHLKDLFAEHAALLKTLKSKATGAAKKVEAAMEEGFKKTGL